jgi:hypothetical protein
MQYFEMPFANDGHIAMRCECDFSLSFFWIEALVFSIPILLCLRRRNHGERTAISTCLQKGSQFPIADHALGLHVPPTRPRLIPGSSTGSIAPFLLLPSWAEVTRPAANAGQVLVRIKASGVARDSLLADHPIGGNRMRDGNAGVVRRDRGRACDQWDTAVLQLG